MNIFPINCGFNEISCIYFIRSCPAWSIGCAFPAKINCTGLCSSFNICVIRSKSLNINVALLYVANLLAKPIVNAFGFKFPTILFICSYEYPLLLNLFVVLSFTKFKSFFFLSI